MGGMELRCVRQWSDGRQYQGQWRKNRMHGKACNTVICLPSHQLEAHVTNKKEHQTETFSDFVPRTVCSFPLQDERNSEHPRPLCKFALACVREQWVLIARAHAILVEGPVVRRLKVKIIVFGRGQCFPEYERKG
eukprot:6432593-Amphidinium_carterae.1